MSTAPPATFSRRLEQKLAPITMGDLFRAELVTRQVGRSHMVSDDVVYGCLIAEYIIGVVRESRTFLEAGDSDAQKKALEHVWHRILRPDPAEAARRAAAQADAMREQLVKAFTNAGRTAPDPVQPPLPRRAPK